MIENIVAEPTNRTTERQLLRMVSLSSPGRERARWRERDSSCTLETKRRIKYQMNILFATLYQYTAPTSTGGWQTTIWQNDRGKICIMCLKDALETHPVCDWWRLSEKRLLDVRDFQYWQVSAFQWNLLRAVCLSAFVSFAPLLC